MKALIRNAGETVLEGSGIEGIDWQTGAPLTNPAWAGGAYALCSDCPVNDPEPGDFDITEEQVPDASAPAEEDGTAEVPAITRRVATFNAERYAARKAQEAQEEPAPGEQEVSAPESPQEAPEGAQQDDVVIIDGVEYRRAGA